MLCKASTALDLSGHITSISAAPENFWDQQLEGLGLISAVIKRIFLAKPAFRDDAARYGQIAAVAVEACA